MTHNTTIILALSLLMPLSASAEDVAPQPDNGISAHNVQTGELVWANDKDLEVGNTRLILRDDGLEVIDRRGRKEVRYGLSAKDGTPTSPTGSILARSVDLWPPPPVTLDNGWTLHEFSPGNDKKLVFVDSAGDTQWQVDLGDYAHSVTATADIVIVAKDYLADDALLRAWKAGDNKPAWTFDLNSSAGLPDRSLRRVALWPQSSTLLVVQSHTHLFGLDPRVGKLLWHIDAVAHIAGTSESDLYESWGIEHASIAFADDVMVVVWGRLVGAWRLSDQSLLWSLVPDTDPHAPSPLIYDDVLYLSTGSARTLKF